MGKSALKETHDAQRELDRFNTARSLLRSNALSRGQIKTPLMCANV